MEFFGSTVKKIRENKGLLMKELYADILSRSSAYRFERDEANVSFRQFRKILSRLNISSLDEFVYLRGQYFNVVEDDDDLILEFKTIRFKKVITEDTNGSKALDFYHKYRDAANPKAKYLAYLLHIDYLLSTRQFDNQKGLLAGNFQAEYDFIHDYLLQFSSWTIDELEIFPMVSWCFDTKIRQVLFDKFKKSFLNYQDFYNPLEWKTKYMRQLLNYSFVQALIGNYQGLMTVLTELDALYIQEPQLRTAETNNYCLYKFICGLRAAYLKNGQQFKQILSDLVAIRLALNPASKVMKYYETYLLEQITILYPEYQN